MGWWEGPWAARGGQAADWPWLHPRWAESFLGTFPSLWALAVADLMAVSTAGAPPGTSVRQVAHAPGSQRLPLQVRRGCVLPQAAPCLSPLHPSWGVPGIPLSCPGLSCQTQASVSPGEGGWLLSNPWAHPGFTLKSSEGLEIVPRPESHSGTMKSGTGGGLWFSDEENEAKSRSVTPQLCTGVMAEQGRTPGTQTPGPVLLLYH